MNRYFFDIDSSYQSNDEDGMVLTDRQAIEAAAIKTLLELAQLEAANSYRGIITVTVRNETGLPVYRATLSMQAGWLIAAAK